MATVYRIHPAIGIMRVGNSDEFFVGPERDFEVPNPPGGFKDGQCRVKRQAARFRIYAHHDDGSFDEITNAEADIQWTVHLVNKKAAHPDRGNTEPAAGLTIDPGPRTTTGPDQRKLFDTGTIHFSGQPVVTVPLGEMRSDDENRLLVMGGSGTSASPAGNGITHFWINAGWYDDIADGPVSAQITIRATNEMPPVVGAWVISAPPKFAPHQQSPTTLYDRILQAMVDAGLANAPNATSYTQDVYPILQRARDIRWVFNTSNHTSSGTWADPVTPQSARDLIYFKLKPSGNMPQINDSGTGDDALTDTQLAHMERWKDGNYVNDWAGLPAPGVLMPAGLDRAALDACVGGAFYPGIEAGGLSASDRPILAPVNYSEAFRIDHAAVTAGTISAAMALPWQADFHACGTNWWPVPRPNQVIPQATGTYAEWIRGIGSSEDLVERWHTLGFVVTQGQQRLEVDRCDTASITLLTPHLNFIDVPQGPMGMVREQALAITFEVISPSAQVKLQFAAGGAPNHPQLAADPTPVQVGPTAGGSVATARLWILYKTGAAPSAIPTQTVTVEEPVSGQTWTIAIDGNTVARRTTAVALVLDRSGSMSQDRGDGLSKHRSLQQAAEIFVNVMLEGDGVGLVRYDQDAQVIQPVLQLGAGGLSDFNRNATVDFIRGNSFDPAGATSIGDGIFEGRAILNTAAGTFDGKALAVLTDGVENRSRYIADVAAQINETTYAVGLGTPQNTSAATLQTIAGNHGGFLLITGAIATDNRFLLQKYFLQILAGVSGAEVVLDPDGELAPGAVHRIPFRATDGDSGIDVVLMSPFVERIDFRLQTPNGFLLEPWRALAEPAMRYVMGNGVSYYRVVLPTQLLANRFDQGGTWHALLTIGAPRLKPTPDNDQGVDHSIAHGLHASPAQRLRIHQGQGVMNEQRRRFSLAQEASAIAARVRGGNERFASANDNPARRATLPYSLIVHSYGNLSLRAQLRQDSFEPGAHVSVDATLTESGVPVAKDATVWGDLVMPDGATATLDFVRGFAGRHSADFVAGMPGVYRLRVRAAGRTRSGMPFTRERSLTAAAWHGGNRDAKELAGGGGGLADFLNERDDRMCKLLACLLSEDGAVGPEAAARLRAAGLDLDRVRKCLAELCRGRITARDRDDG